jgi:acyl-CoA synthetase (AMP-forming)/AMP-acid ligase II
VDGENLAAAAIEDILARFADAVAAAVQAVPDPVSGDQVMAALSPGRWSPHWRRTRSAMVPGSMGPNHS